MEVKFRNPGLDQAQSTRPGGDRMQRPERPQEPDSSSADLGGENQLDFFRKLGYSSAQVRAVMQKFGADTDRVLGELVRMGASPEGNEEGSSLTSSSTRSSSCSSSGVSELGSRGGSSREAEGPESPDEGGESYAEALRPIVIDGSNVAMSHGNKEVFSCRGIQLAVDFFLERGHSDVIVFVPSWRKEPSRPDVPISDQHLLRELEKRKIVVFTPSRRVAGKRVVCYDDRFIVKLAHESAGVIVSNDTYRDLQGENPEWKRFIEGSLLMYFFVSDRFIVPDDPLGRHGPTLDNFLRRVPKTAKKHPCPYGRKCTYGIKCKFDHPERGHQSNMALADELREKVKPSSSQQGPPVSLSSGGSLSSGLSQCLSLEEEMAQKLSLQHHHSSSAPRKYPASENVPVKGGPHSGRRNQSRKEKAGHPSSSDREPLRSTGSQLQLDSGLGSIENHSTDVSGEHGSRRYAEGYGLSHPALSQGPPYYPASTGPCSCCMHAHPTLGNPTTTSSPHQHPHQHSGPHHSMWPLAGAPNPDAVAYGPALYLGPGPFYPMSMQGHSHPTDFQNRRVFQPAEGRYWSDPYATVSHAVPYGVPGERPAPWGYHQPPSTPAGGRETARKKLLAIFNSQLVDQAMEMNPNVLDPQVLVAEIIRLQGQDRARR